MAIGRRRSDGKTKGAGEKFNTMTFLKKGELVPLSIFCLLDTYGTEGKEFIDLSDRAASALHVCRWCGKAGAPRKKGGDDESRDCQMGKTCRSSLLFFGVPTAKAKGGKKGSLELVPGRDSPNRPYEYTTRQNINVKRHYFLRKLP